MKIGYWSTGKGQRAGVIFQERNAVFVASRPVIIQPSEIMKVQTDLFLKVDAGESAFCITTHPDLVLRVGEIFGGPLVLFETAKLLEIPIRNSGRNPLNLMPGQPIAIGFVLAAEKIVSQELDPKDSEDQSGPSVPQKKNPGVKFELR